MASVTWTCPNCQRRVPNRAEVCHCGTTREQAESSARPPAVAPASGGPGPGAQAPWLPVWSTLTWDLKALIIALGLVVVLAAVVLFLPSHPAPVHPLLGYADHPPPTPSPSPTVPARRWKLPWSR